MQDMNMNPGRENAAQFVISRINYFDYLYNFRAVILA